MSAVLPILAAIGFAASVVGGAWAFAHFIAWLEFHVVTRKAVNKRLDEIADQNGFAVHIKGDNRG